MADTKLTALTELSVPAFEDLCYIADDPAGTPVSNSISLSRFGGFLLHDTIQGRLTTETGVPISSSDRTSQSTIYFTPYNGSHIALYDGTRWVLQAFSEISLALSGLTSGANYDVFVYDNAGTLTLELSAAWSDATTRTDALALQDGVYVKSGATTRRWVGTIRTTGTTTTEDSTSNRFVWNAYNRTPRLVTILDTTDSWTNSSATWVSVNSSTANRISVVNGHAGGIIIDLTSTAIGNSDGSSDGVTAFGEDSTTTPVSGYPLGLNPNLTNAIPGVFRFTKSVPLGYHFYQWLERRGGGAGTFTFYGDAGTDYVQSGVVGTYDC